MIDGLRHYKGNYMYCDLKRLLFRKNVQLAINIILLAGKMEIRFVHNNYL
jgi:hypothetical protein